MHSWGGVFHVLLTCMEKANDNYKLHFLSIKSILHFLIHRKIAQQLKPLLSFTKWYLVVKKEIQEALFIHSCYWLVDSWPNFLFRHLFHHETYPGFCFLCPNLSQCHRHKIQNELFFSEQSHPSLCLRVNYDVVEQFSIKYSLKEVQVLVLCGNAFFYL